MTQNTKQETKVIKDVFEFQYLVAGSLFEDILFTIHGTYFLASISGSPFKGEHNWYAVEHSKQAPYSPSDFNPNDRWKIEIKIAEMIDKIIDDIGRQDG